MTGPEKPWRAPGTSNGDGYDDLLVGAPDANGGTGRVYIVFGTSQPGTEFSSGLQLSSLGSHGFTIDLDSTLTFYNLTAGGGRDFDGDGYDDFAFGHPYMSYEPAGAAGSIGSSGLVYVLRGGPHIVPGGSLDVTTLQKSEGIKFYGGEGDGAGGALSPAGDVDGDGAQDLLIGAPSFPTNGAGRAYLVYGPRLEKQ